MKKKKMFDEIETRKNKKNMVKLWTRL